MVFNGLNPWIVKHLIWFGLKSYNGLVFGVVWIINVEGWIGLGGLDLYRGSGLVGIQVGFWPISRATVNQLHRK